MKNSPYFDAFLSKESEKDLYVNRNETLLHFLHQLHQCAIKLTLPMIEYILFDNHRLFFASLKMYGSRERMVTFSQIVIF